LLKRQLFFIIYLYYIPVFPALLLLSGALVFQ